MTTINDICKYGGSGDTCGPLMSYDVCICKLEDEIEWLAKRLLNYGYGITIAERKRCEAHLSVSSGESPEPIDEHVFRPDLGGQNSACMHQGRLVFGGAEDCPNRLWMSRRNKPLNFDLGLGLDDDAIEFAIISDQVNAIREVISEPGLLRVITDGFEWQMPGDNLTPANVQLHRVSP